MVSNEVWRRREPSEPIPTVWPFGDYYFGSGPRDFGYYKSSRIGKVLLLAVVWGAALCVIIVIVAILANI